MFHAEAEREAGWAIIIDSSGPLYEDLMDLKGVIARSGWVPKEGTPEGRPLADHRTVNSWEDKVVYHEYYSATINPTVEDIISFALLFHDTLVHVAKVDIAKAYKRVRIHPKHAPLFASEVGSEKVVIPLVLTFGSRLAPIVFGVITKSVVWALTSWNNDVWNEFGLGGDFSTFSPPRFHVEPPCAEEWRNRMNFTYPGVDYESIDSQQLEALAFFLTGCWFPSHPPVDSSEQVLCFMYIDDIMILGKKDLVDIVYERAQKVITMLLGSDAINEEKLVPSSPSATILGWECDFSSGEMTLSQRARGKLRNLLFPDDDHDWVTGSPTRRMFKSLFGCVMNASAGRTLAKCNIFAIKDAQTWISSSFDYTHRRLGRYLKDDINYWRGVMSSSEEDLLSHPISLHSHFDMSQVDFFIFTDASNHGGGGAIVDRNGGVTEYFQYSHSARLSMALREKMGSPSGSSDGGDGFINYLEAFVVMQALELLSFRLMNKNVFVFSDNSSVVSWLGTSKTPPLKARFFTSHIAQLSVRYEFRLERGWVPTHLNSIADDLSRRHYLCYNQVEVEQVSDQESISLLDSI